MHYGEIISVITLFLGALMGLGALFSPAWASGVVRLVEDPDPAKPGGYAEFRATYGGLFLFAHLITALMVIMFAQAQPILSIVVVLPLAAGWIGAGFGRTLSLILDRSKNRARGMNPVWVPFEVIFGLLIAAPIIQTMGA